MDCGDDLRAHPERQVLGLQVPDQPKANSRRGKSLDHGPSAHDEGRLDRKAGFPPRQALRHRQVTQFLIGDGAIPVMADGLRAKFASTASTARPARLEPARCAAESVANFDASIDFGKINVGCGRMAATQRNRVKTDPAIHD